MTKTQYLYGHNKERYSSLLHYEAIALKLEDAKRMYKSMQEAERTYEVAVRLKKIEKAMNWARDILEEE